MTPRDEATSAPGRLALFIAFLEIGAFGFGGVAALARHVLVVKRGFLDERDFAETFGLASSLPGANTVNLATLLGDRFAGPTGAIAALAGLMGAPLAILVVAATLLGRYGGVPDVKAGLAGAAAAGAGLVGGTSLRLLAGLGPDALVLAIVACVGSASLLRVPMLPILLVAIPVSLALTARRGRRSGP